MASLPFTVAGPSSTSHRNSFDAAWLDRRLHHHQRFVALRCARGPPPPPLAHNARALSCSKCRRHVCATKYIGRENGESTGSWPPAAFRSDSSSSSPEAEDVYVVEDKSEVVAQEKQKALSLGKQSGIPVVNAQSLQVDTGEDGLWSVVIPTYNRLPILTKCLQALEEQADYELGGIARFEVIVVDDGSTDGTVKFLTGEIAEVYQESQTMVLKEAEKKAPKAGREDSQSSAKDLETGIQGLNSFAPQSRRFPHVKLVKQKHAGATTARNLGLKHANGSTIVFIDSDLVVTRSFLRAHGEALREAFREDGDDRAFTYGRVINTSNFENPQSEKVKITDYSAAFFATGNVAVSRRRLFEAGKLLGPDADGPFDAIFSEYGWEDLELGVRLKQLGARIKHAPDAVGYHWHSAFSVDQLPKLIEQEKQRGRNGVRFYQRHPNLSVQLMIQMTPFHELLWFLLTLGGFLNERTLEPLLRQLERKNMNQIAAALVSPILNWHTVQAVKEEAKRLKVSANFVDGCTGKVTYPRSAVLQPILT